MSVADRITVTVSCPCCRWQAQLTADRADDVQAFLDRCRLAHVREQHDETELRAAAAGWLLAALKAWAQ